MDMQLPRLFRRGHIEAGEPNRSYAGEPGVTPPIQAGPHRSYFMRGYMDYANAWLPRLFRRGHIEAVRLCQPAPRLHRRYPAYSGGATSKPKHAKLCISERPVNHNLTLSA